MIELFRSKVPVVWRHLRESWQPNATVARPVAIFIVVVQVVALAAAWRHSNPLVPRPGEIAAAFVTLWRDGLAYDVAHSVAMNVRALAASTAISAARASTSRSAKAPTTGTRSTPTPSKSFRPSAPASRRERLGVSDQGLPTRRWLVLGSWRCTSRSCAS